VSSQPTLTRLFTLILGSIAALSLAACEATTPNAATSDVVDKVAFVDREQLTYELVNVQGDSLGTGVLAVRLEGTRFVLEQHFEFEGSGDAGPSADKVTLAVDAETLRPFGGLREAAWVDRDGRTRSRVYDWEYDVDNDVARLAYNSTVNGNSENGKLPLRQHYYDNESSLWLWRTLPFSEEFEGHYVSVNPLEGKQQTVKVQTPSTETIEVPAGTFEVWRLIVRNGRSLRSAWINIEAPHEVVQWDNGDVIFRLQRRELLD
jgi:hypothetical protein